MSTSSTSSAASAVPGAASRVRSSARCSPADDDAALGPGAPVRLAEVAGVVEGAGGVVVLRAVPEPVEDADGVGAPGVPHPVRARTRAEAARANRAVGEVRGEVRGISILPVPRGRRSTQEPRIRGMRGSEGVRPEGFEPPTF